MPRFTVEAEFSLYTDIEYDGYNSAADESRTADFTDNSSFGSETVTLDGGSVTFVIEAEDEDQARFRAEEVIADGGEVEDRFGLTWVVTSTSYEITRDELSRDEALVIVRRFLDGLVAAGSLPSDVREAFDVLLQDS